MAALRSRIPCARLLITAGADPRIHDKLGRTPGDLAAQLGNEELKDMLSKVGQSDTSVTFFGMRS